jgi:hypothetical protein
MEYLLDKSRSRQRIEIVADQEEDWFLDVSWIEKKTSKVAHTSRIVRKDLEDWLRYLQGSTGGNWKLQKI